MSGIKRCTLSLPAELVAQLDRLSVLAGVSRSALVAELLAEPVSLIDGLLTVSARDSSDGLKRLRGGSAAYVQDKVSELMSLLDDDIFKGGH